MPPEDFSVEFHVDVENFPEELSKMTRDRLLKLAGRHNDMTGASVAVRQEGPEAAPDAFQARIVAYIKPDNMAVVEKGGSPETALRITLDVMERKIRKHRQTIRDRSRGKQR